MATNELKIWKDILLAEHRESELNTEKVKSVVLATKELKIWKDILLAFRRESELNTEKGKSVVVATKELKLRDTYYWLNTEKVN